LDFLFEDLVDLDDLFVDFLSVDLVDLDDLSFDFLSVDLVDLDDLFFDFLSVDLADLDDLSFDFLSVDFADFDDLSLVLLFFWALLSDFLFSDFFCVFSLFALPDAARQCPETLTPSLRLYPLTQLQLLSAEQDDCDFPLQDAALAEKLNIITTNIDNTDTSIRCVIVFLLIIEISIEI